MPPSQEKTDRLTCLEGEPDFSARPVAPEFPCRGEGHRFAAIGCNAGCYDGTVPLFHPRFGTGVVEAGFKDDLDLDGALHDPDTPVDLRLAIVIRKDGHKVP